MILCIQAPRVRRLAPLALVLAAWGGITRGQPAASTEPSPAAALAAEAEQHASGIAAAVGGGADLAAIGELAANAMAAAEAALALDPKLPGPHAAVALVHRQLWRWSAARRAYERAYALAPNDPSVLFGYGWFNSFSGRHPQAIAMAERGVRLAPSDANAHRNLGVAHAYGGNAAAAADAFRLCNALDPQATVCHVWLGFMLGLLGQPDEAAAELALAEQAAGEAMNAATTSSIAHGYSRIGRGVDAARLFARLERLAAERVVGAGSWPLAYLAIGDAQQAYTWLERAVAKVERHEPDEGFFNLMIIKGNVLRNPLLDEPRFAALRERIGAF